MDRVKSALSLRASSSEQAERALILSYAGADVRDGIAALLALDATLGGLVRRAHEPLVGQMRLTWWHGALEALDRGERFAEPVLAALRAGVVPYGVGGTALAAMIDGWEPLLDPDLAIETMIDAVGAARGTVLFRAMAQVLGARDAGVDAAGAGWALADVARHLSDQAQAARFAQVAEARLAAAFGERWSRAGRPLGALALAARYDLRGVPPGQPSRVVRFGWHRLTGL